MKRRNFISLLLEYLKYRDSFVCGPWGSSRMICRAAHQSLIPAGNVVVRPRPHVGKQR